MKALSLIISVLALLVFCFDPAVAVDKTKKDKTPLPQKTTEVDKEIKTDKVQISDNKPDSTASRSKKTYDSFIDSNNNGIDDRAEKKTSPQKTPKDTASQQTPATTP